MAQPQEDDQQRWADALSRMAGRLPDSQEFAPVHPPSETPAPTPSPQPGSRPARPTVPSSASQDTSRDPSAAPDLFDDDRVNIPAPTPDMFLRPRAPTHKSISASASSLESRRTLVPILLTCGVLLPTMGGLWFLTDADSPFRKLSPWMPIALIVIGTLLLFLGLLNVLQLKHILAHRPRQ